MHELTNLELRFIIRELQPLVGGRLDNVYGAGNERFRLRIRASPAARDLIIDFGGKLLYLTKRVEKAPADPDDFVMGLRKRLKNAKLESIQQHEFDRVAVLDFSTKEGKYCLIIELFSNGNLVLCDSNHVILSCLRREEWKDRTIAPRNEYLFPRAKTIEPSELSEGILAALMTVKHIISTLARAVPIGTLYLEEALERADIDAEEKGMAVDGKRLTKLAEIIGQMVSSPSPRVYERSGSPPQFSLCELSNHSLSKATSFSTLSEAIDEAVAKSPPEAEADAGLRVQKEKLEHALAEQRNTLGKYEQEEREARAKGDAVYSNYELASSALEDGRKARKPKVELEL